MLKRELVRTKRELGKMMLALRNAKVVAADTETSGLDWQNFDVVIGVSFATEKQSWYVVLDSPRTKTKAPCEIKVADLKEIWETERTWVWHNAKFDCHMLGLIPAGINDDTLLMAIVLDPDRLQRKGSLKLKTLATELLEIDTTEEIALAAYMAEHDCKSYADIPIGIIYPYACADVEYTLALYNRFMTKIRRRKLERVYKIERRLLPAVIRMEERGVPVDIEYLKKTRTQLEKETEALYEKLAAFDVVGPKGASPKKLLARLNADGFKIKSTAEPILSKIDSPIAKLVLDHRSLSKLRSTYIESILNKQFNGRISMDLRQAGARTGRMSCANPNLQNIPNRKGDEMVRRAFINPGPEWQMLYVDYSQIEMVIFAEISGDPRLQEAVRRGDDLHAVTGQLLYGVKELDAVTDDMRREGKTTNFATIYSQGVPALSAALGVSQAEGKKVRNRYFKIFPSIKSVQERTMKETKRTGYTRTLFGRVRPIRDKIVDGEKKCMAYIGLNSKIQGTAADIMKIAAIRLDHYFMEMQSKLLMCIHDDAMIQHKITEPIIPTVVNLMTRRFPLKLPLRVDVQSSVTSWADKKGLTDEVLLDRIVAQTPQMLRDGVNWDQIGADGLEMVTPHFERPVWLVRKASNKDRLELVV